MSSESTSRTPKLTVVGGSEEEPAADAGRGDLREYELDWSILMARAQAGDAAAYRRLLEAAVPYLRSLAARRHRDRRDIEDAVQDVLLTVHAVRHTYDPSRPFGPWLVAIANRRFVDRLRKQGRSTAHEVTLNQDHETFAAPDANIEIDSLERRALSAAIEGLPPKQREAIKLLKIQELSLKEASIMSGMSIASLKVSVHRGLKSLRKAMPARDRDS
jgi:RNA polymerase sigma-70 factor (ECF subfamily)